jgi:hypothetical protein
LESCDENCDYNGLGCGPNFITFIESAKISHSLKSSRWQATLIFLTNLLQGIPQEWWRCEPIHGRSYNQPARVGFGRTDAGHSGEDL